MTSTQLRPENDRQSQPYDSRGQKTRRQILDVAVDVASVEGLEGLTIGRLARELQMSKSGLFAHFGSKQDLQLATVEGARLIFEENVLASLEATEPGLPRLAAMLEAWIAYVEGSHFRGGCFFAAAGAEFDGRPGPVRDRLTVLIRYWWDALQREAEAASSHSHLKKETDPPQLAFELHAFVQEANLTYQLFDDAAAFPRAREAVAQRLQRAATPSGRRLLGQQ